MLNYKPQFHKCNSTNSPPMFVVTTTIMSRQKYECDDEDVHHKPTVTNMATVLSLMVTSDMFIVKRLLLKLQK